MRLFDSHCHINDESFRKDFKDMLTRMEEAEVSRAMIVGIDAENSEDVVKLAESQPHFYASVGVHPHDARQCRNESLDALKSLARHPKVKAWGETGLDFNRMFSPQKDQEKWFVRQLETADELDLPLIFHERDTNGRFLELLKAHYPNGRNGVVHCFSGNREELEGYLELGLHIGITGILTIKKRGAGLRKLMRHIPVDRLLVETDAPYLTPAPQKNKTRRNEPSFVRSTFMRLADILEKNPEDLSEKIWQNTCGLFHIS